MLLAEHINKDKQKFIVYSDTDFLLFFFFFAYETKTNKILKRTWNLCLSFGADC